MKTLLPTLLALLISGISLAQPTITANDLTPEFGSSVTFAEGTYVDPGPSGADQTWDLSGMSGELVTTSTFAAPDGLPESGSFPGANQAAIAEGAGGTTLYDYNIIYQDYIEELGHYSTAPMVESILIYSDARTQVELPLNYNGIFDDTYESEITTETNGNPPISSTETGSLNAVVDGYGTLMTPAGTFSNVLRVKYEIEATNTVTIGGEPFITDITEVEYQYYKADIPMPLARLTTSTTSFMETVIEEEESGMYYMNSSSVGFAENATTFSEIQLYPVPASTQIQINLNSETATEASFSLLSVTGRIVHRWSQRSLQAETNQIRLELPELASGTYLIQIQGAEGMQTKQVVLEN